MHHTTPSDSRRRGLALSCGAALLVAAALSGCGITHQQDFPTDASSLPAATSNPQAVTAEDFGYLWPLTTDHGHIECIQPDNQALFITPDGSTYALNEKAKSAGVSDIGTIVKNGGHLGALSSYAISLCALPNE